MADKKDFGFVRAEQNIVLQNTRRKWCSSDEGPLLDVLAATECLECVRSHIQQHWREHGNGSHNFEPLLVDILGKLHSLVSKMWQYDWQGYDDPEEPNGD